MALALGVPHPDMLENVLSTRQLAEWEIYGSMEPFGEYADWVRLAIIASMYRNSHTPKHHKRSELKDFIPEIYLEEKKEQSMGDMKNIMTALMNISKGRKRGNKKHGKSR